MHRSGLGQVVTELRLLPKAFVPLLRSIKRLVLPSSAHQRTSYEIAIVLLLSDAAQNYVRRVQLDMLQRYRIEHGISARPHISLKLAFKTFDLSAVEEYFDELVRGVKPVHIVIKNFGFFDEGIIFLDIQPNPPLEALRQQVLSDLKNRLSILPHPIEGAAYHFHATVAHGLSRPSFDEARETLKDESVGFEFTAATCALFLWMDGQWITYKQASLNE